MLRYIHMIALIALSVPALCGCSDMATADAEMAVIATSTQTSTPAPTDTASPTATATCTATPTHTFTPTATATHSPTLTPTQEPTATLTETLTLAPTQPPTLEPTLAPTEIKVIETPTPEVSEIQVETGNYSFPETPEGSKLVHPENVEIFARDIAREDLNFEGGNGVIYNYRVGRLESYSLAEENKQQVIYITVSVNQDFTEQRTIRLAIDTNNSVSFYAQRDAQGFPFLYQSTDPSETKAAINNYLRIGDPIIVGDAVQGKLLNNSEYLIATWR